MSWFSRKLFSTQTSNCGLLGFFDKLENLRPGKDQANKINIHLKFIAYADRYLDFDEILARNDLIIIAPFDNGVVSLLFTIAVDDEVKKFLIGVGLTGVVFS